MVEFTYSRSHAFRYGRKNTFKTLKHAPDGGTDNGGVDGFALSQSSDIIQYARSRYFLDNASHCAQKVGVGGLAVHLDTLLLMQTRGQEGGYGMVWYGEVKVGGV